MGIFVGSIVLNVSDSIRASEFWSKALGYVPQSRPFTNPEFLHPTEWSPPSNSRLDHGPIHLHLNRGDRTHLDLWVDRGSEFKSEVERLISLGAKRVPNWPYPPGANHVVLADPEANLFCVIP